MSHLSDGQLHAYLDRGLGAFEEGVARQVRTHLDGCPDCQSRLTDARNVREQAAEILAVAQPASVAPPPFERLERRAAGVAPRAGRNGMGGRWAGAQSLAWAASLAVALTAGWLARGTVGGGVAGRAGTEFDDASGFRVATEVAGPAESAPSEARLERTDPNETLPPPARKPADPPAPAEDEDRARVQERSRDEEAVRANRMALRDSAILKQRGEAQVAETEAAGIAGDAPRTRGSGTEAATETEEAGDELAVELKSAGDGRMANAAAPVDALAQAGATISDAWTSVDRDAAEALLGGRLRTHGDLPVISVRARSTAGVPEVWTSQQLASGHTLDLVQLREDAGPSVLEGGYESEQQLRWVERVRIDGFVIEASAPVSPDSLRALVNGLKD